MVGRHKLLIAIAAIILIPILVGMTPLNLFQKLSSHRPLSQGKHIQRASSCLFHSIVSQDDFNIVILNSNLLELELPPSLNTKVHNLIYFNISLISAPLRC
jgi:hypothetical protein